MKAPVIILPRTKAGRELLRAILLVAHDLPGGDLPDGLSIYDVDFDDLAIECERDNNEIEQWLAEWEGVENGTDGRVPK